MGMAKARVLPEPVLARATMSRPWRAGSRQALWMGKRCVIPRACRASNVTADRGKLSSVMELSSMLLKSTLTVTGPGRASTAGRKRRRRSETAGHAGAEWMWTEAARRPQLPHPRGRRQRPCRGRPEPPWWPSWSGAAWPWPELPRQTPAAEATGQGSSAGRVPRKDMPQRKSLRTRESKCTPSGAGKAAGARAHPLAGPGHRRTRRLPEDDPSGHDGPRYRSRHVRSTGRRLRETRRRGRRGETGDGHRASLTSGSEGMRSSQVRIYARSVRVASVKSAPTRARLDASETSALKPRGRRCNQEPAYYILKRIHRMSKLAKIGPKRADAVCGLSSFTRSPLSAPPAQRCPWGRSPRALPGSLRMAARVAARREPWNPRRCPSRTSPPRWGGHRRRG